ncbi:SAM-dependent methyltransferase [Marinobacterium lacunae]|uniref:SAM-dependent methyltransferase n=1 Tax=Marinobacterium lacunae TaxID=1232683 RepID=A0A081G3Y4_9GAMM|nr:DUF938 domain-containing protein [Marinobacterium lacunae]KEA65489.1 SAM-dependent methyltransferase [Marinobacterium lacunae]
MTAPEKPYSPACDNNKEPILQVLRDAFADRHAILEIGSGTGQHAVHFATALDHLVWQTSDLEDAHPGIMLWIEEARLPNLLPPLALDVTQHNWPSDFDGVFTANTTHIMPWSSVIEMMTRIGDALPTGGVFCQYGPFNYGGRFTSESNARFDLWLKQFEPSRGIRDFEAVEALAHRAGLELVADHEMPANNRLLQWVKRA